MFKSVEPILFFAGALFISISVAFYVTTISIGFMVFGGFCIFASFLK